MRIPFRRRALLSLLCLLAVSCAPPAADDGGEGEGEDAAFVDGELDWAAFTYDVHAIEDRWLGETGPTPTVWFVRHGPFGPPYFDVAFRVSAFTAPGIITIEVARHEQPDTWLPPVEWSSSDAFGAAATCLDLAIPDEVPCGGDAWQIQLVAVDRLSLATGALERSNQILLQPLAFVNAAPPQVQRLDGVTSLDGLPDVFAVGWSEDDRAPGSWAQPSIDETRPVRDLPERGSAIGGRAFPLTDAPGDLFWLVSSDRLARFRAFPVPDSTRVRFEYSTAPFEPGSGRLPVMPPFEEVTVTDAFVAFAEPSLSAGGMTRLEPWPATGWDLYVRVVADFALRAGALEVSPAAAVVNATQLGLDEELPPRLPDE